MKTDEKIDRKDKNNQIIRRYKQYLLLEKSLSPNTQDAYLADLDKLLSFLLLEDIDIFEVTLAHLQSFAAGLHDIGVGARSQARIISGVKSFFRFLIMEDYIQSDPTELLESPQIGFKLPEVLSVGEVDRIIAGIDLSEKDGQRHRAT